MEGGRSRRGYQSSWFKQNSAKYLSFDKEGTVEDYCEFLKIPKLASDI